MGFPVSDRVIYGQNPLAEVACELRFPRIFALDRDVPSNFQSALGLNYPFVEVKESVQLSFSVGEEPTLPRKTLYEFATEDRKTRITVSSESIAISTTAYKSWDEFRNHILSALLALRESYPVSSFTRIGLRYIDIISRKKLGLTGNKWTDLIKPSALGLLSEDFVKVDDVFELGNLITMAQSHGKLTLRYGLAKSETDAEELVYVVDSDFFNDHPIKDDSNAIVDLLTEFNKAAGNAFRWFITPVLHDALKPSENH